MRKNNDKDLTIRLGRLSKQTQLIINDFLNGKAASSRPNYKSVIIRTFELLNDKKAEDLTIYDYDLALLNFENQETNTSCIKSFFREILVTGVIKEKDSFTKRFYEEDNLSRNNITSSKKTQNWNEYMPALSFKQIQKLQEYILIEFEDFDKLLSSFLCYIFFCTDCTKEEVRRIKATDYKNGKVTSFSGNDYIIPLRYEPLFNTVKNRGTYKGFSNMYPYLKKVEPIININKLTPQVLINARKEHSIKCGNCGRIHANIEGNWCNIAGRIVCRECAENLKKNLNYGENPILKMEYGDTKLEDDVEKAGVIFGYDKLKNKLLHKPVDFKKLHEFYCYIGKLGEAYVYKMEKLNLKPELAENVDDSPSIYNNTGYDIISFTPEGEKLYIEVKTEAKDKENDFYLSDRERMVGEELTKQGKKYYIYRVHNILSEDESLVRVDIIKDIFSNPNYKFAVNSWRVSKT